MPGSFVGEKVELDNNLLLRRKGNETGSKSFQSNWKKDMPDAETCCKELQCHMTDCQWQKKN